MSRAVSIRMRQKWAMTPPPVRAAADQVVLTDLFQSQGLVQVFFQIAQDLVDHIVISGTQLLGRQFRRFPPDQTNEQFLQGGTQQLFTAVWRMFRSLQPCDPGVAERRGESGGALLDDPGQQGALGRPDPEDPLPEQLHIWRGAEKADHHQVGSHGSIGLQRMEFPRSVKDQFPLSQFPAGLPCGHKKGTLVHIEKFPEVMTFSGKGVAAGIFKIMYSNDLLDTQRPGEPQGTVFHMFHLLLPCGGVVLCCEFHFLFLQISLKQFPTM